MAASNYPTTQLPSTHFLESCGAIPFHLSTRRIMLITRTRASKTEYFLAKGRRNISESRLSAALRETREETGYTCRALPVTLDTRATPTDEAEVGGRTPDVVRTYEGATEPFMMTLRQLGGGVTKVIWWFVGAVEEGLDVQGVDGSEVDGVVGMGYEEAVERCTFESDREVLRRAISLVEERVGREEQKKGDEIEGVKEANGTS